MQRYIDAEVAKDMIYSNVLPGEERDDAMYAIDLVPTADVQKVIHAHWVDAEGIPVCSHCGHATEDLILEFDGTAYVSRIPYFCGKCGAKMDEEEE